MPAKVAVSKIVIQIGDKELALSLKEAQELRGILNATLQSDAPPAIEHHYHYPWSTPTPLRWDRWSGTYGEGTLWATNTTDSTLKALGPGLHQE